jgi:MFS family permease
MGVIAAYRRVLGNPALVRLLAGEFVSSIGDWLYLVALLVLVWEQTSDPLILGVIGAARIVPYVLLSVPAGIVADRFDRRLILLTTDVVRGVIMLLIAGAVIVGAPVWVVVVLAIVATCFSAFFSPAIGAYLPRLVRDESELGPANSVWSSLDNLAFFIGPAIAAGLLTLGSLELAFLLNALTFGIVAVVLWQLPAVRPSPVADGRDEAETGGKAPGLLAALRPIRRPLAGLGLLNLVDGFVFGGLSVLTVVLAANVFGVDEATGTGLLNSAIGLGGIAGALVAGAFVLRRRLAPPLLVGAVALGLGVAALGQVGSNLSLALVAMAIASAGALVAEIVATTLLQRIVPDAIRGRALGLMETVTVSAYAAGSFVVPILGAIEPRAVLLGCGVAMVLAGVGATALLGSHAIQRPAGDGDAARLAGVSLFAGLPPATLERAIGAASSRPMKAGEVLIRQGEEADLFYLIVDGEVEVSQAGPGTDEVRVLRRMGSDEFFGEIGLLSGVPRTATVTAITDGRLVTLDRAAFLALVSAGPGLTYRLLDLHRGASAATEH